MNSFLSRHKGYLFAMPWILGLAIFMAYPFVSSIYYSFTNYSVLQPPEWVGLNNYKDIWEDKLFWKALGNTFIYAGLSIPLGLIMALTLALSMHGVKRGTALYSVVFYLPHLMPPVASAILWMWMFNAEFGLLNNFIRPIYDACNYVHGAVSPEWAAHLKDAPGDAWAPPAWLGSKQWALPAMVIMSLWSAGQSAFIYLAKLQDVPQELYEAADLDGASTWHKIWHITLPMISPIIFFNMIMGIIGAFQVFTGPYLMTGGGPDNATYFLPQYIFDNAFMYLQMGYACAMGLILFLIILVLTMLAFWWSSKRVYYAGK